MIGTKLGSYEIVAEIGKGGLATVYRAYQPNIGRHVAIKVLRNSFEEEPEAIARFQREARMIARLEHIHILPVYDFDGKHNPPYIVMRLLEGGTLKELLNREALRYSEVISIFRQISSALDYAHRQGVIHRDIKPSNIMITKERNVFVTDFGLARLVDRNMESSGQPELTQAGMVMGTPGYMAPEQGMGEEEIDHRADLYSLGVILFQMLTGGLPYVAPTAMGVLLQHFQEPIPSAVERNSSLPPVIDEIFYKALAKAPEDRYQSAGEMVQAVASALGETPETLTLMAPSPFFYERESGEAVPHDRTRHLVDTGSSSTAHDQYKYVTLLYANFAEFAEFSDVEDDRSADDKADKVWESFDKIILQNGGRYIQKGRYSALALWGAITTREDDPERAIYAALEMQKAIRRFIDEEEYENEPLPMQIGINTGHVLLTRNGETDEYTVSGTTTNIVQRLERLAPIGSIMITHDTFRQVRGVFNFESSDPLRIRGRKERIPTYLVRSIKPRAFRQNTRGVEGVETRMVGRKAEFDMLQDAFFAAVEDRETQVVTIVSEPGLGKSRLLYEFTNWAELEEIAYWVFQGRATPEMAQRPYALLRDVFSFRFEIQDNDSPLVVRQKLAQGFEKLTGIADERAAHFIGHLLGFDFSDSPHLAGVLSDANQLQKQALYYLDQFFIRLTTALPGETPSRHAPAIVSLEDIHWADESSLDAINSLVSQNPNLPLLFICLARPEIYDRRPTWGRGQNFHIRIDLRPLTNRESRQLVREILQKAGEIPDELRDLLVERAEGNPFMMEELIKILIEDHVILKEDPAWRVELDRLSKVRVPPTLTGLMQVRLDSLFPAERLLLQRAAVLGRIFWDSAIGALEKADNISLDVEAALEGLANREFIFLREESAFYGAQEYIFSNQFMRDVVYESLVPRQRRAYHAQVANWLIEASGERVVEYTASIAENYQLAGESGKAIEYLQQAGDKARQISAFKEALAFYQRANAILPLIKGAEALQVNIEVRLGEILWTLGDFDQARQSLLIALSLARALNNPLGQSDALYQLGRIAVRLSQLAEAETFFSESLELATENGNLSARARAHYGLGIVTWRHLGDFSTAKTHYQACLDLAREAGDVTQTINALLGLGINAMRMDAFPEAHEFFREGQRLAIEAGNQERLATLLLNEGELWRAEGDFAQARNHYNRSLSIARIIGEPSLAIVSLGNLGFAAMQSGDVNAARQHFLEVLQDGIARGIISNLLTGMVGMAWIEAALGNHAKALSLLGLVFNHPAGQDENIRGDADPILVLLRETHSENEIQHGLASANQLDFNSMVSELLENSPVPLAS